MALSIDIFNLSPLFDNGEPVEVEAKKCFICGCYFTHDSELCSSDCEDEFNHNKKFEADNHFALDYDENQND
jgi:predicted nucleic acid-binding Zn ribbon protein